MPRLVTDYSKTQIYRFICNDINITNTYIGSTTSWVHRKSCHKSDCNNENSKINHLQVYQIIRENGGWNNWNMILVENYPCLNKREAEQREQYWKKEFNDDMGSNRSFITKEDKKEDRKLLYNENKEVLLEKSKQYKLENKELISDYNKKYQEENNDAIAQRRKQYREQNKEKIREQNKKYNQNRNSV